MWIATWQASLLDISAYTWREDTAECERASNTESRETREWMPPQREKLVSVRGSQVGPTRIPMRECTVVDKVYGGIRTGLWFSGKQGSKSRQAATGWSRTKTRKSKHYRKEELALQQPSAVLGAPNSSEVQLITDSARCCGGEGTRAGDGHLALAEAVAAAPAVAATDRVVEGLHLVIGPKAAEAPGPKAAEAAAGG